MKKFMQLLAFLICLTVLTSCSANNEEGVSIDNALQISAVLYNEENDTYAWEVLELNEAREMLDVSGKWGEIDTVNIPLHFAFDGICEIIAEDKDIQLSLGKNAELWSDRRQFADQTYGFEFSIANGGYLALNPFGSGEGELNLAEQATYSLYETFQPYPGREYYLTVNACDFDGTPVIRAKLKLVQLESDSGKPDRNNKYTSPYYTIELVEYEYSDIYKMMEGIPD